MQLRRELHKLERGFEFFFFFPSPGVRRRIDGQKVGKKIGANPKLIEAFQKKPFKSTGWMKNRTDLLVDEGTRNRFIDRSLVDTVNPSRWLNLLSYCPLASGSACNKERTQPQHLFFAFPNPSHEEFDFVL